MWNFYNRGALNLAYGTPFKKWHLENSIAIFPTVQAVSSPVTGGLYFTLWTYTCTYIYINKMHTIIKT